MGIRLDEALRERGREDAVDFVADVWARSGWETSTDGATVTATRAGETRRLLVCHGTSATGDVDRDGGAVPAVDAVLSTGDDERAAALASRCAAASVSVSDLYRRLSYGMSVEERDRVIERYFDAEAVSPPETDDSGATAHEEGETTARSEDAPTTWGEDTAATRGEDTATTRQGDATAATRSGERPEATPFSTGTPADATDGDTGPPEPRGSADPPGSRRLGGSDTASDGEDGDERSNGDATRRIVAFALLVGLVAGGSVVALGVVPGLQASAGETAVEDGGGGAGAAVGPGTAVDPEAEAGTGVVVREAISTVAVAPDRDGERRYVGLHPTCNRPPGLVVKIQLGALRQNDETLNKGIRTVWRFASPETQRATGPYPQFVRLLNGSRYRPMFEYTRAAYEPLEVENGTARQRVSLTTPNGSTATYEFRLSKQSDGEYDDCWMTDGVLRADGGAA